MYYNYIVIIFITAEIEYFIIIIQKEINFKCLLIKDFISVRQEASGSVT